MKRYIDIEEIQLIAGVTATILAIAGFVTFVVTIAYLASVR
jgi:hypothetical protein